MNDTDLHEKLTGMSDTDLRENLRTLKALTHITWSTPELTVRIRQARLQMIAAYEAEIQRRKVNDNERRRN